MYPDTLCGKIIFLKQLATEAAQSNVDLDCLGLCLTLSIRLTNPRISLSLNVLLLSFP